MKKTISIVLILLIIFAVFPACAAPDNKKPASDPTSAPLITTTDAPENTVQSPETTATSYRTNEKGPFDDAHYEIGARALAAIDDYLDGKQFLSVTSVLLSNCKKDLDALPALDESDPLYAGNDFVSSYVFLAAMDFSFQLSDFETKKYEDRNYLAAAIGEPTKDFAASSDSSDETRLRTFLDGLVSALNDGEGDTLYYYSLSDDGVFFTISMPAFDYVYDNIDSLSDADLAAARGVALDFVSGEFAQGLVEHVHSNGGASKSVYITLGCTSGICMSSRDLAVYMDYLKK